MSNHVPVMDEPSAHAKVHKVDRFIHVIKEIENLEHFYYAKVPAAGSKVDSKTSLVHFGSKPVPLGPNGRKLHPRGPDGQRLDDETSSSDGSYVYYDRPDTPMANIPNSKAGDD